MSITEKISSLTVRIESRGANGVSTGSGFYHGFCKNGDDFVPAIVTNKHVLEGADQAVFVVSTTLDGSVPNFGDHVAITHDNIQAAVIPHPDPNIDLLAVTAKPVLDAVAGLGKRPFFISSNNDDIVSDEALEDLRQVEDIVMIGYPNGLWDQTNNLPLIRRGITATPLHRDFQGRPEFVIDCACFPGSSGSPVFVYNSGLVYSRRSRSWSPGERVALAGILYAGPQHTAEGEIVVRPVPTRNQPVPRIGTPNNLGYCIKARELLVIDAEIAARIAAQPAN